MQGHNYGDKVRVVKLNEEVIDLCAGTHVHNTSEIESLKITKFEKKGSGIYRLEAIASLEGIKRVFRKINNEIFNESVLAMKHKADLVNIKLAELNLEERIYLDDEINNFPL